MTARSSARVISLLAAGLLLGGCPSSPATDDGGSTSGTQTSESSSAPATGSLDATTTGGATEGDDSSTSASATTNASADSSDDTPTGPPVECDSEGFYIVDGRLYDVNCNEFILRGINYPYAWYSWRDDTAQQFADMASAGANAVRVVLANGEQWDRVPGAEVTQVIDWARDNDLVAVLEVHDATGWSESAGAAHPQTAVDYWLSPDVRAAIDGNEAFVIINIANEPLGNDTTDQWVPFHTDAIAQLRAAGMGHTLVVDAPNWGQDWTNTMRDGVAAQQIFDADPEGNVMFSVHMYDVYGSDRSVQGYIADFLATGLPLMVGEFAADHGPGAPVAAEAIMSTCEAMDVGYMGWSWSGNSEPLTSLDIAVDFDASSLTPWGQMLVDGANGLLATSDPCTCFDR